MALDDTFNYQVLVQIRDTLCPHSRMLYLRLADALLHIPYSSFKITPYPKYMGSEVQRAVVALKRWKVPARVIGGDVRAIVKTLIIDFLRF